MKRALTLIGTLALLVAAAPPPRLTAGERGAIDAVKAQLKDPDAAQFKRVKEYQPGYFCGWVNSKNSYGGYTGFAAFFINGQGKVAILTPELSDESLCQ